MTKLSVWYIRQLLEKKEILDQQIEVALCNRVDLYRFTSYWDGIKAPETSMDDPRWKKIAFDLANIIRIAPPNNTAQMEEDCLSRLLPLIEARLPFDVGPPPIRPFGCWTYELGWEGIRDPKGFRKWFHPARGLRWVRKQLQQPPPPPRDIVLHIMNVVVPKSPFDDMPALVGSLKDLIAEVRRCYPTATEIWCNTWLNRYPKFRPIFPDSWFTQNEAAPIGPTRNWWGQFATSDGSFHTGLTAQFRASGGKFPYPPMLCHTSINHVESYLKEKYVS